MTDENKAPIDPLTNPPKESAIGYVHTAEFSQFLESLRISLLVTTYQAQRIMVFAPNGPKLSMLMRVFPRPTGIAMHESTLALVTKNQVWFFEWVNDLRDMDGNREAYDLCYVPRRSHVTGDIAGHEAQFVNGELCVVNTRFSCLCTLDPHSSFVPIWKPPFISEYVAEDRCHLNGLVVDSDGPKYVTALSETNSAEGWRTVKSSGGVLLDVPSGEIVTRGMAMPHSPRLYRGQLFVLESGLGELQLVNPKNGQRTTVARLPGYLRGLAFYDRYAFVGLCKIRDKHTFGGLPIEGEVGELKCALYAIDLTTGNVSGFIEFTKGIEELFDIAVLPGVQRPHIIGFEEAVIDGVFVLPTLV